MPTVLPYTTEESKEINSYANLKNDTFGTGKGQANILVDIIAKGFEAEGLTSVEECVKTVSTDWNGELYLMYAEMAWMRLQEYYSAIQ